MKKTILLLICFAVAATAQVPSSVQYGGSADNDMLRKEIEKRKQYEAQDYSGPEQASGKSGYSYSLRNEMSKRVSGEYQSMVGHFKGGLRPVFEMDVNDYGKLVARDRLAGLDGSLQHLTPEGSPIVASGVGIMIPAGSRITAILDQEVNSDYPGYFIARITTPHILNRMKIVLQNAGQLNDRVQVKAVKVVSESGKEFVLEDSQVEMEYPGLHGEVARHWMKRMGPSIVNAAIGGGFVAWAQVNQGNERIDTRDAIVAPIVESSTMGLQNEISKLGGDVPNTVTVPMGTQFNILLIKALTVSE